MRKYGTKTGLNTSEVIKKAVEFFGEGSLGLKITEKSDDRVCFEGGGGFVTVTACPNDKTDVDIETREWEHQVEKFIKKL